MTKLLYIPNGLFLTFKYSDFGETTKVEDLRLLEEMITLIVNHAHEKGNKEWVELNNIQLPIVREDFEIFDDVEYYI